LVYDVGSEANGKNGIQGNTFVCEGLKSEVKVGRVVIRGSWRQVTVRRCEGRGSCEKSLSQRGGGGFQRKAGGVGRGGARKVGDKRENIKMAL